MAMALINCPECGKEVSSSAKICPHCGKKLKKSGWLGIIISFLFILWIGGVFGNKIENRSSEKTKDVVVNAKNTEIRKSQTSVANSLIDKNDAWWKQATPEQVEQLIIEGADVNAKDEHGNTALMSAAGLNKLDIVITLIEHGADVNARSKINWSALIYAVMFSKNPELVETLIKHGADVNAKLENGYTVLMFAIQNGNPNVDVIEKLIKHGANVNAKTVDNVTVLMFATMEENPEIVETLIKYGADVNVKDGYGATALMIAAIKNQDSTTIEILINHGANVKIKDNNGNTVLDYAQKNPKIYQKKVYWLLNALIYQ